MRLMSLLAIACLAAPAPADENAFSTGPVIEAYGPAADVPGAAVIPDGTEFRISFDTAEASEPGELNRTLVAAARFLNMHARVGVPSEDIHLAIVVHGRAVRDMSVLAGDENANAGLIEALLDHNVGIYVCGQSAAYYDVTAEDLLPGVTMSVSAMTAHARLQQDGFTLNPF